MSTSEDRKKLIEEKKRKLAELQERKRRPKAADGSSAPSVAAVDINALVNEILGEKSTPAAASDHADGAAKAPAHRSIGSRLRRANQAALSMTPEPRNVSSIAPAERIQYSKQAQTDYLPELDKPKEEPKAVEAVEAPKQEKEPEPVVEEVKEAKIPELTPEEAKQIVDSEDFQDFFYKSSRIVERALNQRYDPTSDYSAPDDTDGDANQGEAVWFKHTYSHERWSMGRAVTCIDWSPKNPELMCVSYNENPDAPQDPDGIVLVWNVPHLPDTFEYKLECQSAVLSACFATFSPHLIVGGTYSGQVVLWDIRDRKRTPVQRSSISAQSHTHPVYCIDIVGTENAHNLITASTDGKLCSWNLDMLNAPQDTVDLKDGASKAVAATCFSFPTGDINNFLVGSEEGMLYQACRHGAKAGVGLSFSDLGSDGHATEHSHYGPVTAVDFHKGTGDFSHLFLSASTDWTVKLWSYRNTTKSLYSFEESGDYVYDVAWSPVHPAVFATADGMGKVDFWNLNQDTEQPTARVYVGESTDGGKLNALNRIKWTANGRHVAVGDITGKVHIYEVGDRLAHTRLEDTSRFKETLADMQASNADEQATGLR